MTTKIELAIGDLVEHKKSLRCGIVVSIEKRYDWEKEEKDDIYLIAWSHPSKIEYSHYSLLYDIRNTNGIRKIG